MKRSGATAVVATILISPFLIYALLAEQAQLVRFFPDDAFYYLQPARHFVRTGVPSFDGLHSTNGFHPLYFLIAASQAAFVSKPALVVLAFATNAVFTVLAVALAVGSFRLRPEWLSPALLAALATPPVIGLIVLSAGLEASTVLLSTMPMLAAFEAALNRRLQSTRRNLLLGVTITLFMLARLDNLIVLVPFVLVLAGLDNTAWARCRGLISVLWLPVLFGSAYLTLNYFWTGHLVPISGYVKHTTRTPWSLSWQSVTGGRAAGLLVGVLSFVSSLVVLAVAAVRRRSKAGCRRARICSIVTLNAGNLLFHVYLAWLASHLFRWYFALPLACLVINVVFLVSLWGGLSKRLEGIGRPAAVGLIGLLLSANLSANGAFLNWVGNRQHSTSYQLKKVAEMVNAYGGPEAVTGTLDAGVIGYYGTGTVINLDGLANNFEYYEGYRRPGRLWEYIRKTRMTHLLVRDCLIENLQEVQRGSYRNARCRLDRRIVLRRQNELFRHTLPGNFTVYYFALEPLPRPQSD